MEQCFSTVYQQNVLKNILGQRGKSRKCISHFKTTYKKVDSMFQKCIGAFWPEKCMKYSFGVLVNRSAPCTLKNLHWDYDNGNKRLHI